MARVQIKLDEKRCVCCYACVVACLDAHCGIDANAPALRRAERREDAAGTIRCTAVGCLHCANAPCLASCPTGAIYRDDETSLVLVESDKCIGCRKCLASCPVKAPKFTEENKMVKCDGCVERVKRGELPLCVKTCPSGALSLVWEKE